MRELYIEQQAIIMLRGLPGSGKSTWTAQAINHNPLYKAVGKDWLRAMFDNYVYTPRTEKFILKARDALILLCLDNGFSVIVDDTNLHPKHERTLRKIAREKGVCFVILDFTHVPLEVCIERDAKRERTVGKRNIVGMYNDFIKQKQWSK